MKNKKIFLVILFLLAIITICTGIKYPLAGNKTVNTQLQLTIDNVSNQGIDISIYNDSYTTYQFDEDYEIHTYKYLAWRKCPLITDEYVIHDILNTIGPHKAKTKHYNFQEKYGILKSGKYRLSFSDAYVEFTIK